MDWDGVSVVHKKDDDFSQIDEDLDLAIALSLQEESSDGTKKASKKIDPSSSKPLGLTDPQWELIDPNPDIYCLFRDFNAQFFSGKLSSVEVRWSRQMTLCAGVCCYEGRGGLCSVRLSLPLLKLRPRGDLVETLLVRPAGVILSILYQRVLEGKKESTSQIIPDFNGNLPVTAALETENRLTNLNLRDGLFWHEMIHAYLFVTANNKDHDAHGPQFLSHMHRINKEAGTKISVYHSFHDEVDYQRKHWWKCDGPCSQRRPFFGIVKRAMNRAPGPNDRWWSDHQSTCGGKFTKIVEPENYKQKNLKRKQIQETKEGKSSANIKSFFQPSTSYDSTPASTKKKKDMSGINNVKSIFSKENNLVSLDRNEFKPPLPPKPLDSSPKSPFPGQGFVLGSSETPSSFLSKIRKELGYTPLKVPLENSKQGRKPSSKTEIVPREEGKTSKGLVDKEKVLKNNTKHAKSDNLPKGDTKPASKLSKTDNLPKGDTKPASKHTKSDNLPKGDTKPASIENVRKGNPKHATSENLWKGDTKPSVKEIKKEKLTKGNPKKLPASAHSSASEIKENKLKQGSLDKYVNSSPKGPERQAISLELGNNSTMVTCPICYNCFTDSDINMHLDQCLMG